MSKLINSHPNWLSINKIYPYAVVGILLLAVSLCSIGLDKGIWIDEDFTIGMISNESLWEMLKGLREDTHPPLHYVLLYFWSKINSSEEFLRLLSVFFGVSTVFIVMRWIKQYSPTASLLAGIYLAITPIMLRFSQEIRSYSLLVLATAITFLFASCAIDKPEKPLGYIGLTLGLVVAVSTHLIGIMLFLPLVFFIISLSILDRQKIYWNKIIFTFAIPFLIFVYFNFFFLNNLSQKTDSWWMPTFSWYLFSTTFQYLLGLLSLYFSPYLEHLIVFVFLSI